MCINIAVGWIANNLIAIGTLFLALATACTVGEMSRQRQIDRYTKELNLLIVPLRTIYEIGPRQGEPGWWNLFVHPTVTTTQDHVTAAKLINAVDSADQNNYRASGDLYFKINTFLMRLKDMKRDEDAQFQKQLAQATEHLYTGGNVSGGLVEIRYDELKKELESLDKVKRWQFWK